MVSLVKLIGIVMLVAGVIYFLKPNTAKQLANYFMKEPNLKIYSAIAILIGIIFLFAATQCMVTWFVILIGILSIIKGVLGFVVEKKKLIAYINKMLDKPPKILRRMALIHVALGVMLIYAA